MSQSFGFNLGEVKPDAGGFGDPIPEGWYKLQADEGSIEDTNGGGQAANFRYVVEEGDFKGRKIFQGFNIFNASEQAQSIGRAQLAAFATAIGRPAANNPHELLGVTFWGKVKIEKGGLKNAEDPQGERYNDKNKINKFQHINETPKDLGGAKGAGARPANPFGDKAPPATSQAPLTPPPGSAATPPAGPPAIPTPPAPSAPPAPVAPPAVDPMKLAADDGWLAHPSGGGWYYKGTEVIQEADVRAKYAAPAVPPAPVGPPAIPTPPVNSPAPAPAAEPAAQGAVSSDPPWAKKS